MAKLSGGGAGNGGMCSLSTVTFTGCHAIVSLNRDACMVCCGGDFGYRYLQMLVGASFFLSLIINKLIKVGTVHWACLVCG